MEYCKSCGKPCDRSHPAAVQTWLDENGIAKTQYLCPKCAEQSAATQMFFFKYLILPIAVVAGVVYAIVKVCSEYVPQFCGETLGMSSQAVTYTQFGVGITLSLLVLIIALKIILKPWRRIKWYWQLLIIVVFWPAIVLPIASVLFELCGRLWGLVRGKNN